MDLACRKFREEIEGFACGRLSERNMTQAQDHLVRCPDCLDVWAHYVGELPDLVAGVLVRTESEPCRQIRDRIGEVGAPEPVTAELMALHLETCTSCHALVAARLRLDEDLPELATMEPGPDFTAAVLALTRHRPGWRRRWQRYRNELEQRPRFALEAAAALALLLMLFLRVAGISSEEHLASMRAGTQVITGGLSHITDQVDSEMASATDLVAGGLHAYLDQTKDDYRRVIGSVVKRGRSPARSERKKTNGPERSRPAEPTRKGWLSWPSWQSHEQKD